MSNNREGSRHGKGWAHRQLTTIVAAALVATSGSLDAQLRHPFNVADTSDAPKPDSAFRAAAKVDSSRRISVINRLTVVATHVGRMFLDIPEYHDEQSFAVSNTDYGPMAYVFASPFLSGFTHINQINAHGQFGLFVAVIWVDDPNPALPGTALPTKYQSLNLSVGMNCVYLAHSGNSANNNWSGYILPGSEATGCQRPTAATPVLGARRWQHANQTGQADYPGVARFDENAAGDPLIGVRCLNAWCQIGPVDNTVRPPSHHNEGALNAQMKGRIHGWHDDQRLSQKDPLLPKLIPSVRATVTPVPDIETKGLADFTNWWVRVATVWIGNDPTSTKYATKWGMQQGKNVLELAYVAGNWYAQAAPMLPNGSLGPYKGLLVTSEKHLDVLVPGTARFRWRVADDGIWVPCDQGCCRVDAIQ